jgi:hypothetical protein
MNRNSWNYPSLERLDNSLNHTIQNTVLICRLLNSNDQEVARLPILIKISPDVLFDK